MIGEFDLGDLKIVDFYLRTVEDVIQLSARSPAGVRGLTVAVGIFQPGGRQKQLQFPGTPKDVKISGHNDRLFFLVYHGMQILQLILPVTIFYGQMYQENRKIYQLQFNHKPLDAFAKIMKLLGDNFLVGQHRIALLIQQWHFAGHG